MQNLECTSEKQFKVKIHKTHVSRSAAKMGFPIDQ